MAFGIWYTIHMADLPRISRQRVEQQALEAIERAIVEGTLEPYTVLSDRHLAEQLGVSRTPVRDALHLMESSGLVERRGATGWVVAGLDLRDVGELFELRCILEPVGLPHIIEWTDDQLTDLAAMFDEFSPPMNHRRIGRYLRRDAEFHHAIVSASENRRAIQIYERVEREVDRCRHFTSYRYQGRADQSIEEHRRICRALVRRDADAARELLIAHIRAAESKQMELLKGARA